jgi:hypothetical protein
MKFDILEHNVAAIKAQIHNVFINHSEYFWKKPEPLLDLM